MNEYVIIVAGGSGSRMNSDIPKQYLMLFNKPILIHTIQRFYDYNSLIKVICCIHKNYIEEVSNMISHYFSDKKIMITEGGETRFHSVKNGLNQINERESLVAIHDAARPLVSVLTIQKAFESAKNYGSGIPVVSVNESIRLIENNSSKAVNRNDYKIVQTPQCFKTGLIKNTFEVEYNHSFTDDATVFEYSGNKVSLTEGNSENIKITLPNDLVIAESLIKNKP
jgi:2-C-methyl-D-erythritol 4-phosphate cytidylyltransferase